MNKNEFLARFSSSLEAMPPAEREKSVLFYAEAIDDRIEDGMSEEEAVADLGDPQQAARSMVSQMPAVPRVIAQTKRRSMGLFWTLTILGSPIWVPLLISFAVVVLSVYLTIWILVATVWLVAAVFVLVLPLCLVLAVWGAMHGLVAAAITQMGLGLAMAGIGICLVRPALAWTVGLIRLSQRWLRKALSPFVRHPLESAEEESGAGTFENQSYALTHAAWWKSALTVAGIAVGMGLIFAVAGFVISGFDPSVFNVSLTDSGIVMSGA